MIARASVTPPPQDWDFRSACKGSVQYVRKHHPELTDLAEEGSLVVIQRPQLYVERRTDGYREPEVILILGTAHISAKSAHEADRVVRAVRPQNVVVELCRSRAGIMYEVPGGNGAASKGEFQAGGGSFLEVTARMLQLGGGAGLVLRLLLARATQGLGGEAAQQAGGEFRAAREAADACGAQMVLGDRPIEVTLQRAWAALGWKRRLQLLGGLAQASLMRQSAGFDEAVIEQMKEDTAISAMLTEFGIRFPEVMPPLLHERDVYLAWSLSRSKAVNGSHAVVGVVGKGHLPGIVHALTCFHGKLFFRDLAGSRRQKGDLKGRVARRLVFEAAILGLTIAAANWWTHRNGL